MIKIKTSFSSYAEWFEDFNRVSCLLIKDSIINSPAAWEMIVIDSETKEINRVKIPENIEMSRYIWNFGRFRDDLWLMEEQNQKDMLQLGFRIFVREGDGFYFDNNDDWTILRELFSIRFKEQTKE